MWLAHDQQSNIAIGLLAINHDFFLSKLFDETSFRQCTQSTCHFDKVTFRRNDSLDEVSFDEVSHADLTEQSGKIVSLHNVQGEDCYIKCTVSKNQTWQNYRNFDLKILGTQIIAENILKYVQCYFTKSNCPKDASAVWSGSLPFAHCPKT